MLVAEVVVVVGVTAAAVEGEVAVVIGDEGVGVGVRSEERTELMSADSEEM